MDRDVRIGVGDSREGGVIVEQALEAPEIDLDGDGREQDAPSASERPRSTPCVTRPARSLQQPGAARRHEEEQRQREGQQADAQQPAGREFPGRKREQVEGHGPSEDRVGERRGTGRRARGRRAAVPPQCDRRPVVHRRPQPYRAPRRRRRPLRWPQRRSDGKADRTVVDDDHAVASEVAETGRPEREERAKERRKRQHAGHDSHRSLDAERPPEHVGITEGAEPQCVDVVRQGQASAQPHGDDGGEHQEAGAARAARRAGPARKVDSVRREMGHGGSDAPWRTRSA